jgi:excisionase family DNA binding protein
MKNEQRRPLMEPWDVADMLSVSRKTVYSMAAEGRLKSIKFGALLRFDPADVEAYIEANRRGAKRGDKR